MGHVIEPAASGRAKCRACGRAIAKGELRFGEKLPNPFADEGDMTLWFHLPCGAFARPEPFLEALEASAEAVADRPDRILDARVSLDHRRLPRLRGAERAPTGRAKCRHCRKPIAKEAWRLPLVYYEEGRFEPSGFVHVECSLAYTEADADAVLARVRHYSEALGEDDEADIRSRIAEG